MAGDYGEAVAGRQAFRGKFFQDGSNGWKTPSRRLLVEFSMSLRLNWPPAFPIVSKISESICSTLA
jgi:hypothetical protein